MELPTPGKGQHLVDMSTGLDSSSLFQFQCARGEKKTDAALILDKKHFIRTLLLVFNLNINFNENKVYLILPGRPKTEGNSGTRSFGDRLQANKNINLYGEVDYVRHYV